MRTVWNDTCIHLSSFVCLSKANIFNAEEWPVYPLVWRRITGSSLQFLWVVAWFVNHFQMPHRGYITYVTLNELSTLAYGMSLCQLKMWSSPSVTADSYIELKAQSNHFFCWPDSLWLAENYYWVEPNQTQTHSSTWVLVSLSWVRLRSPSFLRRPWCQCSF